MKSIDLAPDVADIACGIDAKPFHNGRQVFQDGAAHAGDLIAGLALAVEMGCNAADIGMTVHPHPTLSELIMMAAEAFEDTITDLYILKKK